MSMFIHMLLFTFNIMRMRTNKCNVPVVECGLMSSMLDCHAGNQGSLPAGDKVPRSRSTKQCPPSATDSVTIVVPPSGNPVNHCTSAVVLQWSSCKHIPCDARRKRKKYKESDTHKQFGFML